MMVYYSNALFRGEIESSENGLGHQLGSVSSAPLKSPGCAGVAPQPPQMCSSLVPPIGEGAQSARRAPPHNVATSTHRNICSQRSLPGETCWFADGRTAGAPGGRGGSKLPYARPSGGLRRAFGAPGRPRAQRPHE